MKHHQKTFNARLTIAIDPTTDPDKVTPAQIERYLHATLNVGPNVSPPYTIVGLQVGEAKGGTRRDPRGGAGSPRKRRTRR